MSDDVAKLVVQAARAAGAAFCRELVKMLPPAEGADVAAEQPRAAATPPSGGLRYLVAEDVEAGHPFMTGNPAPGLHRMVQPYRPGTHRAAGIAAQRWPAGSWVRALRHDGRTTWALEP